MGEKDLNKLLRKLRPHILSHLEVGEAPCPSSDTLRAFMGEELPEDQARHIAHRLSSMKSLFKTIYYVLAPCAPRSWQNCHILPKRACFALHIDCADQGIG